MVDVGLVLGFDETCSKELRVPEEEIDEEVGVVGCGLHGKCVWGEGKRAEGREGGERGKEREREQDAKASNTSMHYK